jgi:hypothetical protein
MKEFMIVASPAFDRRGKRRPGRFDVHLQGGDEVICEATQQPLLDASRKLLRRGVDPSTTICKVRADAPTNVTMRAPIGIAAQYDVMGSAFVRRRLATGPMPSSGIANSALAVPATRWSTKASLKISHNGSSKTAKTPTSSAAPSPTRSPTSATTTEN